MRHFTAQRWSHWPTSWGGSENLGGRGEPFPTRVSMRVSLPFLGTGVSWEQLEKGDHSPERNGGFVSLGRPRGMNVLTHRTLRETLASMPRGNKQTLMLAVFLKNIQRRALRMPSWELWYSLVGTPTEKVFSSELLGAVLFRRQSTVFSGM